MEHKFINHHKTRHLLLPTIKLIFVIQHDPIRQTIWINTVLGEFFFQEKYYVIKYVCLKMAINVSFD